MSSRPKKPRPAHVADTKATTASPTRPWYYRPNIVSDKTQRRTIFDLCRDNVDQVPKKIMVFREHDEPRLTRFFSRKDHIYGYSKLKLKGHVWLTEEAIRKEEEAIRKEEEEEASTAADQRDGQQDDRASRAQSIAISRVLNDLAKRATETLPEPYTNNTTFDTALVNYYRNGEDTVHYHADKDAIHKPIASFSFGAVRPFVVKKKPPPKQKKQEGTDQMPVVVNAKKTGKKTAASTTHKINMADGSLLVMLPPMQTECVHSLPRSEQVKDGRVNVTFRDHSLPNTDLIL
jgi:alkylated DNA repair dioxygenase AlkB